MDLCLHRVQRDDLLRDPGLIHEAAHAGGATLPSIHDFAFSGAVHGIGGFTGLAKAAVPCGFLYLGWEATAVLGEESTKRKINPGRAMIMGTLFLTVWYTFLIAVFEGVSSQAERVKATGPMCWPTPDSCSFRGSGVGPCRWLFWWP